MERHQAYFAPLSVALATNSLQTKPAVTPRSANSYFLAGIAGLAKSLTEDWPSASPLYQTQA